MCKKTQQNEDSIVRDKVENVEKNKKKRNKVLECEKISNECVL